MRFATIRNNGHTSAWRIDGDHAVPLPFDDVVALLRSGPDWRAAAMSSGGERVRIAGADIAPLTPHPEKVICVGANYRDHCDEVGIPVPDHPPLFAKFDRSLIGPYDDLVLPHNSDAVDWEAELGVVIGQEVRHADEDQAWAAIAGYTVVNDISMRDWQLRTSQFLQGKTFEASTPVGPMLVTPDELDHARDLRLTCMVDGEIMQDSTTSQMIFSAGEIVAYISSFVTLVPGDLIATGTPGGVGGARQPAVYLRSGATVAAAIEGVGAQANRCVRQPSGGVVDEPRQELAS